MHVYIQTSNSVLRMLRVDSHTNTYMCICIYIYICTYIHVYIQASDSVLRILRVDSVLDQRAFVRSGDWIVDELTGVGT